MTVQPEHTPQHIAIIMDGNGRWAKERGQPRSAGHRKGAEALKALLGHCGAIGVRYLTLYAFSSENWNRPQDEVSDLMGLLGYYLEKQASLLIENQIRLRVIGDLSRVAPKLREQIEQMIARTAAHEKLHLTIALSYGSRQEITHAAQQLAQRVAEGTLKLSEITEASITNALYTHDLPDPDLLIRTGGEQRLSNFLLWQNAYAELYFTPTYWPDFTGDDLNNAIACYHGRERRYGTV